MTIEEALYAHLIGTSGITAVVATRVYPVQAPPIADAASFQPTIVYALQAEDDTAQGLDAGGQWSSTFTIVCAARSFASCSSLSVLVRSALHGFEGTMGGTGGVVIQSCTQSTRSDDDSSAEDGIYQKVQTFEIGYSA